MLNCTKYILKLFPLILILLVASCAKNSVEDIPSYIKIDSISIKPNALQGTLSHKITDAWVYCGNELIGGFEMPANFPILKGGTNVLSIYAGIKLNGINETRVPYPFYQHLEKTVNLKRDSVLNLGDLAVTYTDKTVFSWIEDFEHTNLSIDTTKHSQTALVRALLPELATSFPYETNKYAGKVTLADSITSFECASHDFFDLPTDGHDVFFEMNYKTNHSFTVGLYVNGTVITQRAVFVVNPDNKWNKIYINLTPTLSTYINVSGSFKVYISAYRSKSDANAEIYFDNLKLLHD